MSNYSKHLNVLNESYKNQIWFRTFRIDVISNWHRWMNVWMDGQMDRLMYGVIDGHMDGWMDGWTD